MTIFNLLLLVLVLVFSTESMAAPGGGSRPTVSDEYDELLLVLQWPTSFCNTHYCDSHQIPDKFTVHGLWPNKNSVGVCCRSPPLQISSGLPDDLRQDMKIYWPNLQYRAYPEKFWVYEYEKHGSCFTEFLNQVDYFQTALAIAKTIGIGDVMKMRLSSGKALEMGQFYLVKDFEHVTIDSRKLFPSLRCNYVEGTPYPQLHEIVFCTDTNKNPKSCTSKVKECNRQWRASDGNVYNSFIFPKVPTSLSGSSRSPPWVAWNDEFFSPQVPASLSNSPYSPPSPPSVAWNDELFCARVPASLSNPPRSPPPDDRNGGVLFSSSASILVRLFLFTSLVCVFDSRICVWLFLFLFFLFS